MKIGDKSNIGAYKPIVKKDVQAEKGQADMVTLGGNDTDQNFLMSKDLQSMKSGDYDLAGKMIGGVIFGGVGAGGGGLAAGIGAAALGAGGWGTVGAVVGGVVVGGVIGAVIGFNKN